MYAGLSEARVNVLAPQEGIYLASRALLSPGDHVVVTVPHYQSLSEVARSIGCELSPWRPDSVSTSSGHQYYFDPAKLQGLLRPGQTKLVVTNFPHNPTGALPTPEDFEGMVESCRSAGAHLLVDEMYRGLEHAGSPQLPAVCEVYEHGVSLSGLSKTVGLPGLRIGWLASQDPALMARVAQLKDYTTICPAAPSEVLGLIALRAQPALLARSRAIVASGLAAARDMVGAHANLLEWAEPRAGTFAFVRLRGDIQSEAYCEALRRRSQLMLMPGALFDFEHEEDSSDLATHAADYAQRVRLTFGQRQTRARLLQWVEDLQQAGVCKV